MHSHGVGTDVYKQRRFTYTGKKDCLLWDEYGIQLQFPSTQSEVHIEGKVSVLSFNDDNYIFPEESELVSAVYNISASEQFPQPVTVKLQHSIPIIDSANEASSMTFVIANTKKGRPYKFQPLTGGSFKRGSSYAEIQRTDFSVIAIIRWIKWKLGHPIPFFAGVFYFQNGRADFVVTQNLEAHIRVSIMYIHAFSQNVGIPQVLTPFPCRLSKIPKCLHHITVSFV